MEFPRWRVGDLLAGRWRIHEILGGGQAFVFVAFDEKARLPVVLRVGQVHHPSFRQEAAFYNEIPHHPNVCTVYEARIIDGCDTIVMGYIDGGDLRSRIEAAPLSPAETLRLGIAVVDGLIHLSAHGISAHGDLKPENILVSRDLEVIQVSDVGGLAYTPRYSAPEQVKGRATSKSDMYSLGLLLVEATTGLYRAFDKVHPVIAQVVASCCRQLPEERPEDWQAVRWMLESGYREITGHAAPDPILPLSATARQLTMQAVFWRVTGNLERARELLELATASPGADSRCYTSFAIVAIQQGDLDMALHSLRIALSFDPHYVPALTLLAISGPNPEEGLRLLDMAETVEPNYPNRFSNRASLLLRLGRRVEAVALYRLAIQEPDVPASIWYEYGAHLASSGDLSEAEPVLRKAVRANQKGQLDAEQEAFAGSLLSLCNVYTGTANARKLRYVARRLRKAGRYSDYGSLFLARAHAWLGELQKAEKYLLEVASLDTPAGQSASRDLQTLRDVLRSTSC